MSADLLPPNIVELARRVVKENAAAGRKVVVAESCTGGLVAAALTEVPGSSEVLDRGFVTYSNEAKQEMLGVPEDIIDAFGAVSVACVFAMAQGALERSGAVSANLSRLLLVGPQGDSTVLNVDGVESNRRVLVASAPAMHAGPHVLHWRTTSSDGHVLEGTIPFVVGDGAATAVTAPDTAIMPDALGGSTEDSAAAAMPAAASDAQGDSSAASSVLPLLRALVTMLLLGLAGGRAWFAAGEAGEGDRHRRGEVQHVDGAPPPHLAVDQFTPERVAPPALGVGRHHIGVAHQKQTLRGRIATLYPSHHASPAGSGFVALQVETWALEDSRQHVGVP